MDRHPFRDNLSNAQKGLPVKLGLRMRDSVGVNGMVGQKMKLACVAVAAFAVLSVVRGDDKSKPSPANEVSTLVDESGSPRPAHEVSASIKQAFPYDPAPAQQKEETKDKEPDAQVVTMERFTVVESMRSRQLEEKIKSADQKNRDERFSIRNGGAILKKDIGRTRVELGAWPAAGAGVNLHFLKITW